MSQILIDAPGAGEWIMTEGAHGYYNASHSHTLSMHDDQGEILGGFVLTDYIPRASAMVHMCGTGPGWCTRELLFTLFDYAFHQLDMKKLFAPVRSDNPRSLELCLRAGWQAETVVKDVFGEGVHCMLLYMTEATCPWLKRLKSVEYPQLDRGAA